MISSTLFKPLNPFPSKTLEYAPNLWAKPTINSSSSNPSSKSFTLTRKMTPVKIVNPSLKTSKNWPKRCTTSKFFDSDTWMYTTTTFPSFLSPLFLIFTSIKAKPSSGK